jgi:hypothetical protein
LILFGDFISLLHFVSQKCRIKFSHPKSNDSQNQKSDSAETFCWVSVKQKFLKQRIKFILLLLLFCFHFPHWFDWDDKCYDIFHLPKHVWNSGMLCLWIETQSQICLYDFLNHKFICCMHKIYHFERKVMTPCSLRDARIKAFWLSYEPRQAIKTFRICSLII